MHRTLPRFSDNNSPHKGAIRKPNQCKTPQLVHNGIHTPSPDPTKIIIKLRQACINLSQHPLQSHFIGKLCDDECIVPFDKHKVIVSKNKDIIIEGYRDPINGFWRFPLHRPFHNNKKANILNPHLCNHSRPMAPRRPRAYRPTSQKDLAVFTIRYSASKPNAPCSRQSRIDPSQCVQDSQRS